MPSPRAWQIVIKRALLKKNRLTGYQRAGKIVSLHYQFERYPPPLPISHHRADLPSVRFFFLSRWPFIHRLKGLIFIFIPAKLNIHHIESE